jgi:hypothetical protein
MLPRLSRRAALAGLAATAASGTAGAQKADRVAVDLELVLAVDCSLSIDDSEFRLQVDGTAAAIADRGVIRAIRGGEFGRIAVTYVQWAGPREQIQAVGWTLVDGEIAALRFGRLLRNVGRPFRGDATSISGAIDFARPLFARNPFEGTRQAIDVSGDGINNAGRFPQYARDEAVAEGIVINGLPIMTEIGGLDGYFREFVIGGAGAFVVPAVDFDAFAAAIRAKLIREIA